MCRLPLLGASSPRLISCSPQRARGANGGQQVRAASGIWPSQICASPRRAGRRSPPIVRRRLALKPQQVRRAERRKCKRAPRECCARFVPTRCSHARPSPLRSSPQPARPKSFGPARCRPSLAGRAGGGRARGGWAWPEAEPECLLEEAKSGSHRLRRSSGGGGRESKLKEKKKQASKHRARERKKIQLCAWIALQARTAGPRVPTRKRLCLGQTRPASNHYGAKLGHPAEGTMRGSILIISVAPPPRPPVCAPAGRPIERSRARCR